MKSFILETEKNDVSCVVTLNAPNNKIMIQGFLNTIHINEKTNSIYFWDDSCKFRAKKSVKCVVNAIKNKAENLNIKFKYPQGIEMFVMSIFENEF